MASPIDTLKAAGFPQEEVDQWMTGQRTAFTAAGFNDDEIDAYLGGPKKPVPQSFLDRLSLGSAIASHGSTGNGPYSEVSMGEAGLPISRFFSGLAKGVGLSGDDLNQQLEGMTGAEVAGVTLGRAPLGMLIDQIREGGASLDAVMSGKPVTALEMTSAALLGVTAPVSRLPGRSTSSTTSPRRSQASSARRQTLRWVLRCIQ